MLRELPHWKRDVEKMFSRTGAIGSATMKARVMTAEGGARMGSVSKARLSLVSDVGSLKEWWEVLCSG